METQPQSQKRSRQAAVPTNAGQEISPVDDALCYLKTYAREKPEMAALWCFGIGFVLGWKLKPW